jgi:adenylate cyclase
MVRSSTSRFLSELKRRKVYHAAAVYVAVGLGVLGAAEVILDPLGLGAARAFIVILVLLGFPITLVLAWAYELKPEDAVPRENSGAVMLATPTGTKGRDTSVFQPPAQSIAVLPFVNLGGDPENEYFADGVTEDVIAQLSKIRALKVISRTSAMSFKNRDLRLLEIAQQLNVATLLEGSVRRVGDRVRVVAQLIDAMTDQHIWAETYDRKLTDIFAIQSELAISIAGALRAELSADERQKLRDHAKEDIAPHPQAYEAYLRGRFHLHQHTPEGLSQALRYFEQALEIDPDYTLALGAIADTWGARTHVGLVPPRDAYAIVRDRVQKAFELDDTLPETNDWLGRLKCWFEWDWVGAEHAYKRAMALRANYPDAPMMYSVLLNVMKRWDEAALEAGRAIELDPLNPLFQWANALPPLFLRQYDHALEQLAKVLQLEPGFLIARLWIWTVLHRQERYEEALANVTKYFEALGDHEVLAAVADGARQNGYRQAMRAAAEVLGRRYGTRYVPPVLVARAFASANDSGQAMQWLEKGYTERDFNMIFLAIDPTWDALRANAGFLDLVRRMQLPE